MKNYFLFIGIVFLVFACKSEPKQEEPLPIDPKDVKIDIEVGGVPGAGGVMLSFKKTGKGAKTLIVPNSIYLSDDFKALADQYTIIFYDLRNRGRSMTVRDTAKLSAGILNDVADLEAVRRFFKIEKFSTIGHSYLGMMVALYAQQYPNRLEKVIQLSPIAPYPQKQYKTYSDAITADYAAKMQALAAAKDTLSEQAYCEEYWARTRPLYVVDQTAAKRTLSQICNYPNEHPDAMLSYLSNSIFPSIQRVDLKAENFQSLTQPVLILHGDKDRVAPLDGARDWEKLWPNAELEVLEGAGHIPWIDKQGLVFNAIRNFLGQAN